MAMLRRGIPLVPQELLGYKLGLTLPQECNEEAKSRFFNPRIADCEAATHASILPHEPQVSVPSWKGPSAALAPAPEHSAGLTVPSLAALFRTPPHTLLLPLPVSLLYTHSLPPSQYRPDVALASLNIPLRFQFVSVSAMTPALLLGFLLDVTGADKGEPTRDADAATDIIFCLSPHDVWPSSTRGTRRLIPAARAPAPPREL
jgi:hypothetical protein